MKAVDPACGMTVETKDVLASYSHKGVTYYFCSEKCRDEFVRDPESILSMMAEREEAAEAERSKSLESVMNQVAHEMRNPLTSIGGFTRRMYERLPEDDPNKEDLRLVIEDVARLESMIRQLVELKAVGLQRKEPSNINDIIEEAVHSMEAETKDLNIQVRIELAENLPSIYLDRHRLTTAICNVMKNALEAMGDGPGILGVSGHRRDRFIEVIVSDTGKGIPEEKIKYVFDPFFTSKIYGPGLGLTLSRRIIQEQGGTIQVKSDLGKGTTVTIRLPLREPVTKEVM